VRLATHREFLPLVAEAGLEYWFLPGSPSTIPPEVNSPLRLLRALVRVLDQLAPQLAAQTLTAGEGADLVVENMLCHTEAVERLPAPWCMVLYAPLVPTAAFPAPGLPGLPLGPAYNRLTHLAAYRLQELPPGRWMGLAPRRIRFPWRELGRERPALFAFSPGVVPTPADWPPGCHVTGYWFWERPGEPPKELVAFLEEGPPPVVLTFGSLWPFAPAGVAALTAEAARRAGRALVVVGGACEPIPDGAFHLADVDHRWLFPRTSAVIHHGGAGTTAAALRAGVPQVVAPFFGDQPFWAARTRALGVAPRPVPMRRLDRDRFGAALTAALTDRGMQDRAARVGTTVRAERGVERACEVLERWVAGWRAT